MIVCLNEVIREHGDDFTTREIGVNVAYVLQAREHELTYVYDDGTTMHRVVTDLTLRTGAIVRVLGTLDETVSALNGGIAEAHAGALRR